MTELPFVSMYCTHCKQDMAECECPDAPERIKAMLSNQFLAFGDEYRERLLAHAKRKLKESVWPPIVRAEGGVR